MPNPGPNNQRKVAFREILERDTEGAPRWIVTFSWDSDIRDLTPAQAVMLAYREIKQGHGWDVIHVASGLRWSVCLGTGEVIEIVVKGPGDE